MDCADQSRQQVDFDDQGNVALALGGEPGDAALLFVVLDAFQPTASRTHEAGGLWLLASNDRLRPGEIDVWKWRYGWYPRVGRCKGAQGEQQRSQSV